MDKTTYETRAAQELDKLAAQIDSWSREMAGARDKADDSFEDLRRRYDTAKLKLHLLRKESESSFEELRGGVEGAMSELRGAMEQARKRLGA
jgi:DNA-binding protein HU-beta